MTDFDPDHPNGMHSYTFVHFDSRCFLNFWKIELFSFQAFAFLQTKEKLMAGLFTIIASYRRKVYVISLTYPGFDPVFLVPVVRINEVQRGLSWEGFYLKKQERKLFFFVEAKDDTIQEERKQF